MNPRFTRKQILHGLLGLAAAGGMAQAVPQPANATPTSSSPTGAQPDAAGPRAPGGLTVARGGQLLLAGRPFRGIGVNYLDAFYRLLLLPGEPTEEDLAKVTSGMRTLADYQIPFARIMGCGYWPSENQLYFDDKSAYLRRFATVVAIAEDAGVGLIPSLFWYNATATDLMDEPRNQWGNPHSRTHAFLRTYVDDVVTRFANSPAIWGWEFGNEYNLDADLPNASDWRPPVVPDKGTRLSRDERDDLTHEQIHTAFEVFANQVRRHDPHRIVLTGNAAPRPSAWHQRDSLSWDQDTPAQFAEILAYENPDPMDVVSVHQYAASEHRFGRDVSAQEFLSICVRESRKAHKPLFVGEFGADESTGHDTAEAAFRGLVDAIVAARVPLSALWVYDFTSQDGTWNVTPTNGRQYQLQAIAEANRQLRSSDTMATP